MGKRRRLHRQAVISGTEKRYRASPDKPKESELDTEEVKRLTKAKSILERARRLKEIE